MTPALWLWSVESSPCRRNHFQQKNNNFLSIFTILLVFQGIFADLSKKFWSMWNKNAIFKHWLKQISCNCQFTSLHLFMHGFIKFILIPAERRKIMGNVQIYSPKKHLSLLITCFVNICSLQLWIWFVSYKFRVWQMSIYCPTQLCRLQTTSIFACIQTLFLWGFPLTYFP